MFEFIFNVLGFNSYDNNNYQDDRNYYSSGEENFWANIISIVSVLLVLALIALLVAYFMVPAFHLQLDTMIHHYI